MPTEVRARARCRPLAGIHGVARAARQRSVRRRVGPAGGDRASGQRGGRAADVEGRAVLDGKPLIFITEYGQF